MAPQLEVMLFHYAFGKPASSVDRVEITMAAEQAVDLGRLSDTDMAELSNIYRRAQTAGPSPEVQGSVGPLPLPAHDETGYVGVLESVAPCIGL